MGCGRLLGLPTGELLISLKYKECKAWEDLGTAPTPQQFITVDNIHMYVCIAFNMTPILDCSWVGAGPKGRAQSLDFRPLYLQFPPPLPSAVDVSGSRAAVVVV